MHAYFMPMLVIGGGNQDYLTVVVGWRAVIFGVSK
jgi:hypothetical protein